MSPAGARDVHAIERASGRQVCVCDRPVPARARDFSSEAEWVECLKCGHKIPDRSVSG